MPGWVIIRTADEVKGMDHDATLWEDLGVAWSGPSGFRSLPKGFLTTEKGIFVDISGDITGTTDGQYTTLGYESESFTPVVTLYCETLSDLESLQTLVEDAKEKLCSRSEAL